MSVRGAVEQRLGATGDARPAATLTSASVPSTSPAKSMAARWTMQSAPARAANDACELPARAPVIRGVFEATEQPSWVSRWIRRPVLDAAATLAAAARYRITDGMQVTAPPWIDTLHPEQVFVWLSVHQTTLDFLNLLPLRQGLPVGIDMRIAARTFKGKVSAALSRAVVDPFLFHVHRTSMDEGGTPEERDAMRAANAKTMAEVRAGMKRRVHAVMFPEGTTMSDGRIGEVKKGCLELVRMPREDGSFDVVPVAPIGFTIDMLAAPPHQRGKHYLTFVNVREPIIYAPAKPWPGESAAAYAKRDAQLFVDRVRSELIAATTITTSQLTGVYLMRELEQRRFDVHKPALARFIGERAQAMHRLGYDVDRALLTPEGVHERVEALWSNLRRLDYIDEDRNGVGVICRERLLREGFDERFPRTKARHFKPYKHTNPLRYCANRLLQLMEHDPRVGALCAR